MQTKFHACIMHTTSRDVVAEVHQGLFALWCAKCAGVFFWSPSGRFCVKHHPSAAMKDGREPRGSRACQAATRKYFHVTSTGYAYYCATNIWELIPFWSDSIPIARSKSNSDRSLICKRKSQPTPVGFFVVWSISGQSWVEFNQAASSADSISVSANVVWC